MSEMSFAELKSKQRRIRDSFDENLGLRVHRALSWLHRAEQCIDDDGKFLFLWIGFNAAYANDLGQQRRCEGSAQQQFIDKLVSLDRDRRLYNILWKMFPNNVRVFLDNQYVFQPYWDAVNNIEKTIDWQENFRAAKHAAHVALSKQDTSSVLDILMKRLYTLRNQIIHGGATYDSSVNRKQMRDATEVMSWLVPIIIDIMMNNPNALWGDACYKVQSNKS